MRVSLVALAFVGLLSAGCGSDSSSVTGPTPAPATLTSLQLTGNTELTAVGQTSQLTLNGVYSDGSTRDLTAQSSWTSSTNTVATVTAGGLVTSVGLGFTNIAGRNGTRTVSVPVTVTPAGTFIIEGRVREPGSSGLPNVRVVEQIASIATQSDSGGSFRFGGLQSAARLVIDLPNYEFFRYEVEKPTTPPRWVFVDAPLQRVVRINAGQTTGVLIIAPNDVSYGVGADLCNPCKLIRVISGGPGTLTLRLTWTGAPGGLHLWANDARYNSTSSSITADVPTGGGQSLIYVGWMRPAGDGAPQYTNFTLSVD